MLESLSLLKAPLPINLSLLFLSKVTDFNLLFLKALLSIFSTLIGIFTDSNLLLLKASAPEPDNKTSNE